MVQSVKARARAATKTKQRKHATKSGARYLTQEEQAQVAADMAELRARHSIRFRGGPMADLAKKWQVSQRTP